MNYSFLLLFSERKSEYKCQTEEEQERKEI